jgi:hypothetical protein
MDRSAHRVMPAGAGESGCSISTSFRLCIQVQFLLGITPRPLLPFALLPFFVPSSHNMSHLSIIVGDN